MYESLLYIEEEILSTNNVHPDEDWEIDVFDESDRLLTTIRKDTSKH
jgi:hypothetical protein